MRGDIEEAYRAYGTNPVKTGWSSAWPRTAVVVFCPAPELVHGVAVNNPFLADYQLELTSFTAP